MRNVLDGVRVLEVAQWWFVPSAGAVLADWGAEVIKIEHPETGDPQRGLVTSGLVPQGGFNFMWEQPNRGKKSVALDLASDGGREILYRIAAGCDVFLTSFLPEARRRLRIDVDDLRAVNPRIVYARGSGQGARGPEAERGGYDGASFWARGGIAAALSADPTGPPVGQRPAFGDGIGGMALAGGIAAALFRRERTGETAVLDLSLLATAMWTLAPDITMAKALAPLAGRMPRFDRRSPPNPIVNAYATKDGRWIMLIMLQSDRDWPDLCRHLGRPELADDPRFATHIPRGENQEEIEGIVADWAVRRDAAEIDRILNEAGVVCGPIYSIAEIFEDPQFRAREMLVEHVDPGFGPYVGPGIVPKFSETPGAIRWSGTWEEGSHNEEIYCGLLGLSASELDGLREDGIV
jgi:crotonobetainyl-CoA:carnitine CoA-transferase CaiB-like acyl-CoA transferase